MLPCCVSADVDDVLPHEAVATRSARAAPVVEGLSLGEDDNPDETGEEEAAKGDQVGSGGSHGKSKRQSLPERLLKKGNAAFRNNNFADAIQLYSEALLTPQLALLEASSASETSHSLPLLLLSNRCAAFCSLSKHLRSIPAAQSERRALFGLDPLSLAQLAHKDAEKLLKEGGAPWPKAHYRRACALILLEKYDEASEAFLSGLHLDPTNELLQKGLMELKAEKGAEATAVIPSESATIPGAGGGGGQDKGEEGVASGAASEGDSKGKKTEVDANGEEEEEGEGEQKDGSAIGSSGCTRQLQGRKRAVERSDEFDCSLCLKLFYAPVTTPCGHTFCRPCLARAMDHGSKCPVCRIPLYVNPSSQPITVILSNILEKFFPEEYQERKEEVEAEKLLCKETIPLFVMDVVLPRQKMALNIFEPRYRLMVRRCMEGSRTLGMVGFDQESGDIADVACEVEIRECEPQHDGRFHLEVEGRRRFKVIKTWEQDGYRMAQVEWLKDSELDSQSNPEEAAQASALAEEAATTARKWVDDLLRNARGARKARLAEYIRSAGEIPPPAQPENLSFWIANLLPTHPRDRLNYLRMTNTSERLTLQLALLKAPERFSSCLVQ